MPLFKRNAKQAEKPKMPLQAELLPVAEEVSVSAPIITRKQQHAGAQVSFRIANLQGIGMREEQQDAFALVNALDVNAMAEQGLMAVVADGMGGLANGREISCDAVELAIAAFRELSPRQDIAERLAGRMEQISDTLFSAYGGAGGTTMVLTVMYGAQLHWVSVGDSGIYLMRDGGLYQLNREHTYRNQLFEAELEKENISSQRVLADPDGHRLAEFLGIDRLGEPDFNLRPLRLTRGDKVLLCSDGITGYMEMEEVKQALSLAPDAACRKLEATLKEKAQSNQDNYTAIVMECV